MMAINLLPESCQQRRRVRIRVHRWASALVGVALMLMVITLWARSTAEPTGVHAAELGRMEAQLALAERQQADRRRALAEYEAGARAARLVADLPNWGLLLATLPTTTRQRASLTSCVLVPLSKDGSFREGMLRAERYQLTIEGVTDHPRTATDIAIELEELKLFDRVTLVETTRRQHMGADAIAFRIECLVADGQGGHP